MEPHLADAFASCPDIEVLSAWHDSELRAPALEAHVANCEMCQRLIATFSVIDHEVHEPVELDAQALSRIKTQTRLKIAESPPSVWARYGTQIRVAAAVVVVGAVFAVRYYHVVKQPESGTILELAAADGDETPETMAHVEPGALAPIDSSGRTRELVTLASAGAPVQAPETAPPVAEIACQQAEPAEQPGTLTVSTPAPAPQRVALGNPVVEPVAVAAANPMRRQRSSTQLASVSYTPKPRPSAAISAAVAPPARLTPVTAKDRKESGAELPAHVRHVWVVDDPSIPVAELQALLPDQRDKLAALLTNAADDGVNVELMVDDRLLVRLVDHFHANGYRLVSAELPQPDSSNGIIFTGKSIRYDITIVGQ